MNRYLGVVGKALDEVKFDLPQWKIWDRDRNPLINLNGR